MIASSPAEAIQTAVYGRLAADTVLTDQLGAAVHDDTDADTPYPYISLGEGTEAPDNAHDQFGRETTADLHVWTSTPGWQQANRIVDRIVALLDHQQLDLDGHRAVAVRLVTIVRVRDPREPHVRHAAVRLRFTTAQTI